MSKLYSFLSLTYELRVIVYPEMGQRACEFVLGSSLKIRSYTTRSVRLSFRPTLANSYLFVFSKMDSFIRSKYESRRWALEGPPPADPSVLDRTEDEVNVRQCHLTNHMLYLLHISVCPARNGCSDYRRAIFIPIVGRCCPSPNYRDCSPYQHHDKTEPFFDFVESYPYTINTAS